MRKISFRVWDKDLKRMRTVKALYMSREKAFVRDGNQVGTWLHEGEFEVMQFTGLLDSKGLRELYEGDILDGDGHLVGNIYEHKNVYREKTDLIIQDFGAKDWYSTYKKAMERGCEHAE